MGKAPEHPLRDARRGQEAAFLRLFDDHHLPLFRFAWRLTGSMADAGDIVQECFLALLRPNFRRAANWFASNATSRLSIPIVRSSPYAGREGGPGLAPASP